MPSRAAARRAWTCGRTSSAGAGTGIALAAAAGGTISGNDITASTTGISITAAFTGTISTNIIHNAQTGVSYQAAAALSDNSIHDNGYRRGQQRGRPSTSGFGFAGSTQPDQIFDNSTGVQLNNATMQNQHVYDNALGVSGSGVLGGSDLDYANLMEANVVTVNFSGPIQYNRITRETVGIEAQSGQLIAYNLLYRQHAGQHRRSTASRPCSIVNNTLYAPTGDNVDISGGSSEIELLNNIFWAVSGYRHQRGQRQPERLLQRLQRPVLQRHAANSFIGTSTSPTSSIGRTTWPSSICTPKARPCSIRRWISRASPACRSTISR